MLSPSGSSRIYHTVVATVHPALSPPPRRRAEHQGLWLDVCEDALVGRAENGERAE